MSEIVTYRPKAFQAVRQRKPRPLTRGSGRALRDLVTKRAPSGPVEQPSVHMLSPTDLYSLVE